MADQRTMVELLHASTKGYTEAIVVPLILAKQFELKHSLINMMTSDQFFGLEKDNPHDHIRAARRWLEKEPPHSILTWEDLVSKFINEFFPPSRTTNLRNEISNFQQRNAKLTHTVNQQTSVVTTAMTAILKQLQATPPPAFVKPLRKFVLLVVVLICIISVSPLMETLFRNFGIIFKDTFQQLQLITIKTFRSYSSPFINLEEDERVEETLMDQDLAEYTIKLHINIPLADALILIPKYQKMLKALLFNKEKLIEPANTPLNENCSAVILKKLPEKLRYPRKFLISCSFSELKCNALADLGASINLIPLSVWKKLGLPELISTCITLELANHAICTPAGIARDVFVPVGKFTFPADFVIVDYESDPRVPLILGRPFLWTARALIEVHGEETILRDGDERLTLNIRHDTSSYSNQPQK
nr:reverse transcriptase domain-containing protein [Tanacetum cinerariifolium]